MSHAPQVSPVEISERISMWLEPPDVVWFQPRGAVTVGDLEAINRYYEQHIRDWPVVFMLVDSRLNGGMSAEARKAAATLFHWVPFRGSAIIGGAFAMRTVGQLLMKVITALSSRTKDNPTVFLDTDAEARAWLEERRRAVAEASREGT